MESPGTLPESPLDQEDVVYPCKGCGEILEEGKAFELAGNRWHIDCFRCNTCNTLLDSDANLLLLGDGSLICNNCTYSCNACGNKIEDLAILTGDQAFCASCFRCRNCKRKIENLRYARTSQGIFCMSCHESLMARRRKKAKAGSRQGGRGDGGSGASNARILDKSLPALPPGADGPSVTTFSPDLDTPPSEYTETPTEQLSPRVRQQPQLKSRKDTSSNNLKRDESPLSEEGRKESETLPASTYNEGRPSSASDEDGEQGFLPMAFDPNAAPGPPPMSRKRVQALEERASPKLVETTDDRPPRDYFNGRLPTKAARQEAFKEERPQSLRSVSTEREIPQQSQKPTTSPHIAYQVKGRTTGAKRDTSGNSTPVSNAASPSVGAPQERLKPQHINTASYTLPQGDGFKLQEAPKARKGSRRNSKDEKSPISPIESATKNESLNPLFSKPPISLDIPNSGFNPFDDPKWKENSQSSIGPPPPRNADRPARGESLAASAINPGKSNLFQPSTPEPSTPTNVFTSLQPAQEGNSSASFVPLSRANSRRKQLESPGLRSSVDAPPVAPPRASSRPSASSKYVANEEFTAPRAPPPPPPVERYRNNDSISTLQSETSRSDAQISPALRSAGLPRQSVSDGFSMEEEMTRIMRSGKKTDERSEHGGQSSVMRRVSKAVKHGRSYSDRGLSSAGKSPLNGGREISSPISISSPIMRSPRGKEDVVTLRAQLRQAQLRITELEMDKMGLEDQVKGSAEVSQMNTEISQKRNTMAILDTQREMVVCELEVMTDHLTRVKDSSEPVDISHLKTVVLQDFAKSLHRLKDQVGVQIEDLIHRRNQLTEEISNLIQMKDKGFQEYETLSTRNEQLKQMANELTHTIQDTYKANRAPNGTSSTSFDGGRPALANGLGIYHPGHSRIDAPGSSEVRNLNLVSTDSSMPDLLRESEAEPATILTAPQVVNIRKGQPKKFNWKKGGQKITQNVTKGLKGAFASTDRYPMNARDGQYNLDGVHYGNMQAVGGSEQSSLSSAGRAAFDSRTGASFGFFNNQKNGGLRPGGVGYLKNNSSTYLPPAEPASTLFGSELEARCEFERRVVPGIVTRCIEEVEARGMDVEGVYRKSGGSGQVKSVQQGFERDDGYDISDPDLDIHAVTSTLKQYFRKLPTPLITYDVYDALLDAGQQQSDREKGVAMLRAAVGELPQPHRDTLEVLLQHLAHVMAQESANLMTPLNLAVVFAPTIMRPLSIEREMSDMQAQRMAVQALLENQRAVFGED